MATFFSDYYSNDITTLTPGHSPTAGQAEVPIRCKAAKIQIAYSYASNTHLNNSDRIPVTGDIVALIPIRSDWTIVNGLYGQGSYATGTTLTASLGLWRADFRGKPTSEIQKDCFMDEFDALDASSWYDWPDDADADTFNRAQIQKQVWDLEFPSIVGDPLTPGKIEDLVICVYFNEVDSVTVGTVLSCYLWYTEAG